MPDQGQVTQGSPPRHVRILRRSGPLLPKWRERGAGMLFALGFNALLLLLLLTMGPKPFLVLPDARMPVTFEMAPEPKAEEPQKEKKSEPKKQEKKVEKRETAKAPERPSKPVPDPVKLEPSPLPFLQLSRTQMASADIGKMPAKPAEAAKSAASGAGDSKAVSGPGEGPGGVQLYEAEWYRRPTHAELAGYMPPSPPPDGWGLVACRTIENYQVDNCQAIGEFPMGSGFARAVRQAAWQFRVLPPRVNGKPMIGSWVRIRIDYRQKVASQTDGGSGG